MASRGGPGLRAGVAGVALGACLVAAGLGGCHEECRDRSDRSDGGTSYYAGGGFRPTGALVSARARHTATLLPSGQVLLAGGYERGDLYRPSASAERYDPATGSFTATGSMGAARVLHTATVLPSGKVLVVGGQRELNATGNPVLLPSAELYDPATGAFTPTGAMATGRWLHTATLLASGKVLVAGGASLATMGQEDERTAELYDPATGTFSPTGPFRWARSGHTATLLPSSKVLVAGGSGPTQYGAAELYDPETGTFVTTGPLRWARSGHTATLLASGQVLVAGGGDLSPFGSAAAELYDPASGAFIATGALATERAHHAATLLSSGQVLAVGGELQNGVERTAEIYQPAHGTFASMGRLALARTGLTATLLPSGEVLVAGGDVGGAVAVAELFVPE
jgi:large repetitive protein